AGGIMSRRIPSPMRSIAFVAAALIAWSVSVAPAISESADGSADQCLAKPNSPAPAGQHWYYHTDSAKQRKCWYTRATDQSVQPAAAKANSDPEDVGPARPIPLDKPATASASGPTSINPADSAAPSPRITVLAVKPQRPPVAGMAKDQPVQQSAEA